MVLYVPEENEVRPVLQIAMPRLPRMYAAGGTMHVVARGKVPDTLAGGRPQYH